MKMKVNVLVVHLLLTAVLAQVPPTCYKNAYIIYREQYKNSPLEFYSKPNDLMHNSDQWSKCGGEWKKYGVCCNPWQLESHVNTNQQDLNSAIRQVNYIIQSSKYLVGDMYQKLKQLSLAAPNSNQPQWNKGIKFAQSFINNITNLAFMEEHKVFPSVQDVKDLKDGNSACWNYMSKLRASSICQTCSGRSKQFFKGDRGLVTEGICYQSLKLCLRPLQIIVQFFRMVKWVMNHYSALKGIGIDCDIFALGAANVLESIYQQLVKNPIIQTVDQMTLTNLESNPKSIPVCNEYFSLAKVPYVQKFLSNSINQPLQTCKMYCQAETPITESAVKIQSELPALEQKLSQKYLDWKNSQTASRSLQLSNGAAGLEIFGSDVNFVGPTDSIDSTSSAGASSGSLPLTPLNLSMIFP